MTPAAIIKNKKGLHGVGLVSYLKLGLKVWVVGLISWGCAQNASDDGSLDQTSTDILEFSSSKITDNPAYQLKLEGPQLVAFATPFSITAKDVDLEKVSRLVWNMGDGTSFTTTQNHTVHHFYTGLQEYLVEVKAYSGEEYLGRQLHHITSILGTDGYACLFKARIDGPGVAQLGMLHSYSLSQSDLSCLSGALTIQSISWLDQAGLQIGSGFSSQIDFARLGENLIQARLILGTGSNSRVINLKKTVFVYEKDTQSGGQGSDDPKPVCQLGSTKVEDGSIQSRNESCGVDGTRKVDFFNRSIFTCTASGSTQSWVKTSESQIITSEGPCQGQSCSLPNGQVLAHGSQSAILSPEIYKQPVVCPFGEEGVYNEYQVFTLYTCDNSSLSVTGSKVGDLISAGKCPTYKFLPTEEFTPCTAACGGTQKRIFACVNESGQVFGAERCAGQVQIDDTRLCDGDPDSVKRQEVTTTQEGIEVRSCPKNQIGKIEIARSKTVTDSYACVNHEVRKVDSQVSYSEKETLNYCKSYIAHRCSHDSLSISEAQGRLAWMRKCQNELPVIKEFLTNFDGVQVKRTDRDKVFTHSITSSKALYPSFLNSASQPARIWVAPKTVSAPCVMPETAFVAAVCVASCATPEQLIMTQAEANKKPSWVRFDQALEQDHSFVTTLKSPVFRGQSSLTKTKVDQWVTEIFDSEHDIVDFHLASGRKLRLTPNHAVVTSDGRIKLAKDFQVGESLVMSDRTLDPISKIEQTKHFGKVYNVFVNSAALHHNVVLVNGYLVGTGFFQNDGAEFVNHRILEKRLLKGVFNSSK